MVEVELDESSRSIMVVVTVFVRYSYKHHQHMSTLSHNYHNHHYNHHHTHRPATYTSRCPPQPPSVQRSELGSPSSSASDPTLRHHSHRQPYNLPSHDSDLDYNDDNQSSDTDGKRDLPVNTARQRQFT